MSLIPLRYECPECFGYMLATTLSSRCTCPPPVIKPVFTEAEAAAYDAARRRFLEGGRS